MDPAEADSERALPLRITGSKREARGSGSVEVLPTSAVCETASGVFKTASVLGGEEGRLLLVRRVSIVVADGARRHGGHLTVDSQIVFKTSQYFDFWW